MTDLGPHKQYGSFDFSNFDKTVTKQLIEIAFSILLCNIDMSHYQDREIPRVDRLMKPWNYIKEYFINTSLLLSNGEVWQKSGCIPSGSYFTQLIGSIVNWIIINYAFVKT